MTTSNEWKEFFNTDYAPKYENEGFTKNTEQEIHFLVEEMNLSKGSRILDVGCGTGRHSVALAKKGYSVTGVDISPAMLSEAGKSAARAGVEIALIESDAQYISFSEEFDAVICLCEGALSLLGSDDDPYDHDVRILNNIFQSLNSKSKFITTVLNGCRCIRMMDDADVLSGRFNPITMVEKSQETIKEGNEEKIITVRERVYTPAEFVRMLHQVGFMPEGVFGGTAGAWNKEPLKLDEMEFMVIAIKP